MSQSQEELQELESLLSDYFGRTPTNSQDLSDEFEEEDIGHLAPDDESEIIINGRVRSYVTSISQDELLAPCDTQNDQGACPDDVDIEEYCQGCGCTLECHTKFRPHEIMSHILDVRTLDNQGKELTVMRLLQTPDTELNKKGDKRQRITPTFRVNGIVVCRKTFQLFYDLSIDKLKALQRHVRENGIVPRTHGNKGRKPVHAIVYDDVLRVVRFIQNVGEERGIPQPAVPCGIDNIPSTYLAAHTTKQTLHEEYSSSCSNQQVRSLGLTAFKVVWCTCLPHIRIASPREDVCATCEKMRRGVMDAISEEEKLAAVYTLKTHILLAQQEMEVYNECLRKSTDHQTAQRFVHFTFDFSQCLSLPHYARQMGPLYFYSLRKIQLFGVRIDGQSKQVNFLIDEDQTIGQDGRQTHGPDSVISMLDWVLENHERDHDACSIHADKCPGQNKNKFVVGYLMWRVMTGQHKKIEYHMQVLGHARCLVDSGFAHIKIKYRRNDCETRAQLASVVEESSEGNNSISYPQWRWRA